MSKNSFIAKIFIYQEFKTVGNFFFFYLYLGKHREHRSKKSSLRISLLRLCKLWRNHNRCSKTTGDNNNKEKSISRTLVFLVILFFLFFCIFILQHLCSPVIIINIKLKLTDVTHNIIFLVHT